MPVYFQIELKESPLHGLGIFAVEKIPKGAVIWSW
jgi:SET domain-containing protein